jgi:glycerol-3-phosphate dehydrogenase
VRPLYDDAAKNASAVTRDYVLDIDQPAGQAPVLSVFGGKITTYRVLAEHALLKLVPAIEGAAQEWRKTWTKTAPLPGGDIKDADFDTLLNDIRAKAPFLGTDLALRLGRAYGTRIWTILKDAKSLADLGEMFGGGLTEAEIDYLIDFEWAEQAADVLWRRSKLGLHISQEESERVAMYMRSRTGVRARTEARSGHAAA